MTGENREKGLWDSNMVEQPEYTVPPFHCWIIISRSYLVYYICCTDGESKDLK